MNKSGNTPLIKNEELAQKFGCTILIKDESKNPFGTWKDRRSEVIIKKASWELRRVLREKSVGLLR